MLDDVKRKIDSLAMGKRIQTVRMLEAILDKRLVLFSIAAVGVVLGLLMAPPSLNPFDLIMTALAVVLMPIVLVAAICGLLLFASFAEITAEMLVDAIWPRAVAQRTAESSPAGAAPRTIVTMDAAREGQLLACIGPAVDWYCGQQEERGFPVYAEEARMCWYMVTLDAMMTFHVSFEDHKGGSYAVQAMQKEIPQYTLALDAQGAEDEWASFCATLVEAEKDPAFADEEDIALLYMRVAFGLVAQASGRPEDEETVELLLQCTQMCQDAFMDKLKAAGVIS